MPFSNLKRWLPRQVDIYSVQRFPLRRYFALASALALASMGLVAAQVLRAHSARTIAHSGEEHNTALAKVLANTTLNRFGYFLKRADEYSDAQLRDHPSTEALYQTIRAQMHDTALVKMQIFDLDGRTIFSTETSQIGTEKHEYPGFRQARAGHVSSQLGHRDTFEAFRQNIQDRALLSSYLPMYDPATQELAGVMEIYTDVTPLYTRAQSQTQTVVLAILGVLSVLYAVLFAIVHHAARLLQRQYSALQASEQRHKQQARQLQQAQAQLVQSEKLSSLGRVAAGVAHEINNPVSFIHGNLSHVRDYTDALLELVQLVRDRQPDAAPELQARLEELEFEFLRDDLPKCLQSMQVGTERIRQIILSLRIFARLDEEGLKAIDLHEALDTTLLLLKSSLGREIAIVKDYEPALPKVECFPLQLNQVFANLLCNASEALQTATAPQTPRIAIATELLPGDRVCIRIGDNGPGIAPAVRDRIFEPFFTTKPVGQGTGLGLSTSYEVIRQHGGELTVSSEPGQGATFSAILPCVQPRAVHRHKQLPVATGESQPPAVGVGVRRD